MGGGWRGGRAVCMRGAVSGGNMGSTQKMQYTVMGDAVNQAARFEAACKIFTILIMIGQSTYDMAKDKIEVRKLGLLVAKFEPAWDIYAKGGFAEAKREFEGCLEIIPDDGPSLAYIEQCEHFTENPPPQDWAGEWIQLTK